MLETSKLIGYFNELSKISQDGNIIYSPTSTRTVLQMYKYIHRTEEFDDLLKSDYIQFDGSRGNAKYINRIWANEKYEISIPTQLVQYLHIIDMSNSSLATREKNLYVADQTNYFLAGTPSILSDDIAYDLMNITYFKDIWKKEGGFRLNPEDIKFCNIDGTKIEVKNFIAFTKDVYENDTCYALPLTYKYNNKFWLIYPKHHIRDVDLTNLMWIEAEAIMYVPEFEQKNDFLLNKIFNINTDSSMSQTAKIKVDHEGTEAVAVTEMRVKGCIMRKETPQRLELTFDRPFMYAIEDVWNKDFIFIGRKEQF